MAASTTSGRITMPGPPPKGVSSTERCLSRAKSRMSTVSKAQAPASSAWPAIDWPSGPGNIWGNSVNTRTVHGGSAIALASVRARLDIGRRIDDHAAGGEIHCRYDAVGKGQQLRRAIRQL